MESSETVIITLTEGPGHSIGTANSATVTIAATDEVSEGFESGGGSGGAGWSDSWSFAGDVTVIGGSVHSGSKHLRLIGDSASAVRFADLSEAGNVELSLWWKAYSFETGEYATVEIYDGSQWHEVLRVEDGQDDYAYHLAEIDLSPFTLTADFQLRIRSYLGDQNDYFKHCLVEASKHCDHIYAVGDYVADELRFLAPEFESADIDIVYIQ